MLTLEKLFSKLQIFIMKNNMEYFNEWLPTGNVNKK